MGDKSWYSISSCFTWKIPPVLLVPIGEDIKIDEDAEVGVRGIISRLILLHSRRAGDFDSGLFWQMFEAKEPRKKVSLWRP